MTRRRGAPPHERACRLGAGCRCARPPPGSPLRSDPAPRGAGGDLDPVSAHRRGAITGSRPRPATQLARHDHDENRPGRLHLSKARFWSERWGPPHTASYVHNEAMLRSFAAIDISHAAISATYENAITQRQYHRSAVSNRGRFIIAAYAADAVPHERDLVVCNPPYIPDMPSSVRSAGGHGPGSATEPTTYEDRGRK